jgi:hypothetical protein
MNETEPVGVAPVTVAVNVVDWGDVVGFTDEEIPVVVRDGMTDSAKLQAPESPLESDSVPDTT